uniref:G-protein coupled receptors family 1 profile domain-containing protein n=2 Tax=Esox lucius TaxID=8010 RepID=A0AAY5KWB0_ESOLU
MYGTPIPNSSEKYLNDGNACALDLSQDSVYLPVLYGLFFVVGTPLNLMALYGLYRLIKSEHVLPVYVINLLLSDLLQLFTLPLWMDYYIRGHSWRFGSASCKLMGVVFYVSIYVSIVFMCVIAVERYLAIAKPLRFHRLRKVRFARWMSLSIWVIVAVPPCIAFNMLNFGGKHTMCIEKYPSEERFVVYRLITLSLTFILPLAFIFSLYWKTLRALSATSALAPEEKQRIRGLLTLLVVIFVVVLGPYHITGCVKYVGLLLHRDNCQWERSVFMPYQVGRGLLSLNSLLDPVLYTFMRSDFRAALGHHLPCMRRRRGSRSAVSGHMSTSGTAVSFFGSRD